MSFSPILLCVVSLLAVASAIVCPPEMLQAAPIGLPAGSKCGGTCHVHGHCAAGLSCQQPRTPIPVLGIQAAGVCVESHSFDADSDDAAAVKQTIQEALILLNARSNDIYMLVPVGLLGMQREPSQTEAVYRLSMKVARSQCHNDGKHDPFDSECRADGSDKGGFNVDMVVRRNQDSSYTLLSHSTAEKVPLPLTM
ncbi:unnamed protein product [Durusdinium trenchii]|uniref:Uncharacterized protein n=2 Tax=Durusdinium trenchii TaxID=1381693 RepID=A0ABP0NG41_9DINO